MWQSVTFGPHNLHDKSIDHLDSGRQSRRFVELGHRINLHEVVCVEKVRIHIPQEL